MASSISLDAASPALLLKFVSPKRNSPPTSRKNACVASFPRLPFQTFSYPSVSISADSDSKNDYSEQFSDVDRLLTPKRLPSQKVLEETVAANPFLQTGRKSFYDFKDYEDAVRLAIDIPGVGKEEIKVWVENNGGVLKFKAGGGPYADDDVDDDGEEEEYEDDDSERSHTGWFALPQGPFKLDQIEATLNNGVLKVVVPKIKLEERLDILNVQVN